MPWGSSWDKPTDKKPAPAWVSEETKWPEVKEHVNKVPTHDPYTNPNAQIYFQCSCGAIHDPGTKSFAALTGSASKAGWKVRFITGVDHYTAYCVKCGEIVE